MTDNHTQSETVSARAAALHIGQAESTASVDNQKKRRQMVTALVLLVVSLLLIGVSVYGLVSSGHDADERNKDALEQVENGFASDTHSDKEDKDKKSSDDAHKDGKDSDKNNEDSDKKLKISSASNAGNSDNNQSATNGNTSSNGSNNGNGSSSTSSSNANSGASHNTGGSDGNTGSSSTGSTPAPKPNEVNITVSVDATAAGGFFVGPMNFTFEEGANAFDALMATGVSVDSRWSSMGLYVKSINGYAEKQHGSMSGWMYYVNGQYINHSCDKEILSNGDVVTWFYVTGD